MRILLATLLLGVSIMLAVPLSAAPNALDVREGCLLDLTGRQVVLRAVNIGYPKQRQANGHYTWTHGGPERFVQLRTMGFNSVRFLIYWDAIEPECGQFDAHFLSDLQEKVSWATDAGLWVVLDMHQDLWGPGVPGGDGAPPWALLGAMEPHHSEVPVWSMAYFTSPLIQKAFDQFWANAPAPDGVGLQDHFAAAWREVARRFTDTPEVLGFDLLNEPFPGSAVLPVLQTGARAILGEAAVTEASDPLALLLAVAFRLQTDPEALPKLVTAIEPTVGELDRTLLGPMHQRVATAIREVAPDKLIFWEPFITANLGLVDQVPPLVGLAGQPDPRQVYAPHIYEADPARTQLITTRLIQRARHLNLPMFIGEWGNLTNSDGIFPGDPRPGVRATLQELEQAGVGTAYWYAEDAFEAAPFFSEFVQRPYVAAVSGRLLECRVDSETAILECSWVEKPEISAPTVVFLPGAWFGQGYELQLAPEVAGYVAEPTAPGSENLWLHIQPTGQKGLRRLVIRGK